MSKEHFFGAIRSGNKVRIERILTMNPSLVHATWQAQWTPLKYAFYCKQFTIAKYLVSKGATLET